MKKFTQVAVLLAVLMSGSLSVYAQSLECITLTYDFTRKALKADTCGM